MNKRRMFSRWSFAVVLAMGLAEGAKSSCAAEPKPLYAIDFSQTELDQVPADFLVLDGRFAVKEVSGNRLLELPGAPLETYGVLFGPAQKADVAVTARILGTGKGRRFPTFALSLNGVSGYRLQVAPAKKQVELLKGENVQATAAFEWQSGNWCRLRLEVKREEPTVWRVRGRVWMEGAAEAKDWTIACEEKTEPTGGRAGVWGSPFAGTPIWFDDLAVSALTPP